jgi:hypothetical protein
MLFSDQRRLEDQQNKGKENVWSGACLKTSILGGEIAYIDFYCK